MNEQKFEVKITSQYILDIEEIENLIWDYLRDENKSHKAHVEVQETERTLDFHKQEHK